VVRYGLANRRILFVRLFSSDISWYRYVIMKRRISSRLAMVTLAIRMPESNGLLANCVNHPQDHEGDTRAHQEVKEFLMFYGH